MAGFDGSGNYTLNFTFATEAASPPIAISKLDTEFTSIAAGLSLCILRNGAGKPTADIDWNTKKITNLANATADADALNRVTADGRYVRAGGDETITGTWSFDVTPTVDGDALWHAGNDGAGSGLDADTVDGVQAASLVQTSAVESGTFTIYLRASHNGADLTSGTATWKKFNGAVTLRIPQLVTTNTTAALYVENLPAAIQPSVSQVFVASGVNNGNTTPINAQVTSDYILLSLTDGSGFNTAATSKGIYATTLSYIP